MKKLLSILKIITALAALVLEFLPRGIKITSRWPISGTSQWGERVDYYSYANLSAPFGSGNFLAPITVLLTAVILIIVIISLRTGSSKWDKVVLILSAISVVTSLPLLYGILSYTLLGVLITILLIVLAMLSFYDYDKKRP